jgi:hypothetical protein
MIDLAQKMFEMRGTIEMDTNADDSPHSWRTAEQDADLPNLGKFRANIVKGGNIPGRS